MPRNNPQNFGIDKRKKPQWDDLPAEEPGLTFDFNDHREPSAKRGEQGQKSGQSKQKMVFSFIVFLTFMALAIGFWSYAKNIKEPFIFEKNSTDQQQTLGVSQEAGEQDIDILELSLKDTDEDGLSDYDELYNYNTSPYLVDSDSDGFTDKEELDNGHDPNCPAGQNCRTVTTALPPGAESVPDFLPGVAGINQSALLSGDVSGEELRSLMLQLGVKKEKLDGLSDEELQSLYQETLRDVQNNYSSGDNPYANSEKIYESSDISARQDLNSLKNLSPEQIRQLLIEGGADSKAVNSLSDEQLMTIYQETIYKLEQEQDR